MPLILRVLILYVSGGTYSLTGFSETFLWQVYILSEFLPEICWEEIAEEIHTNIHSWPLQLFSQDYGIASHIIHVVCVNFIREWWDLQFNVDSERFLRNFFMAGLLTVSFCQKEQIAEEIHTNILNWPLVLQPGLRRSFSYHTCCVR